MAERRHAVEEVCRLPRAGADPGSRLFVGRAGMAERYVMSVRGEVGDQLERPLEFGRYGDDPHVGSCGGDLVEDLCTMPRARLRGVTVSARRRLRRQSKAGERLRTFVVRVDEIAFEVGRQDARA